MANTGCICVLCNDIRVVDNITHRVETAVNPAAYPFLKNLTWHSYIDCERCLVADIDRLLPQHVHLFFDGGRIYPGVKVFVTSSNDDEWQEVTNAMLDAWRLEKIEVENDADI